MSTGRAWRISRIIVSLRLISFPFLSVSFNGWKRVVILRQKLNDTAWRGDDVRRVIIEGNWIVIRRPADDKVRANFKHVRVCHPLRMQRVFGCFHCERGTTSFNTGPPPPVNCTLQFCRELFGKLDVINVRESRSTRPYYGNRAGVCDS